MQRRTRRDERRADGHAPTALRPPGPPRWAEMFYEPSSASRRMGAEPPYRFPVAYAVGEMTQTLRARDADPAVTLWGPRHGKRERRDSSAAAAPRPRPGGAKVPGGEPASAKSA